MVKSIYTGQFQAMYIYTNATTLNALIKGALEGAEPVTCRYKSITAAVLSIVPFEQSTR